MSKIILYKNFEHPSYELDKSGYIMNIDDKYLDEFILTPNKYFSTFIEPQNNINYCEEANIIMNINDNYEGYFDFNKSIIDIGANVGVYSFKTIFNKAYSFEPNKFYITCLNFNMMMHDEEKYLKSNSYCVCLSDKIEDIKFDGFNNEYTYDDINKLDVENIKIVRTNILDEYNCENVGLIKVDVEGMEEKVLRGGIGTIIRNNYPPILFELWDIGYYGMTEEKHNSLEKFLTDLGYNILWYWGNEQTHLAIHK